MTPTSTLRTALLSALSATGLFERVEAFNVADLSDALETLRDSPDTLALVVPSRDSWQHEVLEGDNTPIRAEQRNEFEILVTRRELRHGDDGAQDCVDLKDQLCAALLWNNLATPGLLCLPLETEPMVIEQDRRRGREAWKITVEIRQQNLNF